MKTAVEWLESEMLEHYSPFDNKLLYEAIHKAKEIEKEQKETYKYTEEDLRKAISFGQGMDLWKEEEKIEKFIQSLNQTKQQEQ
jgi:hypothetical protein